MNFQRISIHVIGGGVKEGMAHIRLFGITLAIQLVTGWSIYVYM